MNIQLVGSQIYNEKELLSRIAAGDEHGMRQLYDSHHLAMVHFAKSFTKNDGQAEDAVIDAFIQFWKNRASFHSIDAVKSFLYKVVRNSCLNWLEHQAVILKSQPELLSRLREEEKNMENQALKSELIQFIYKEIYQLPEEYSKVIQLLFIDNLSNEEAAVALGISEANLRMRKSRALKQLRIQLLKKGILIFFLSYLLQNHPLPVFMIDAN